MLQLILANKNYSSWSMRAWLYMTESGLPFEEKVIHLFSEDWNANVKKYNPIAKAPALVVDGNIQLWDSLAIMGFLMDRYPTALQWPKDVTQHALAWSLTAEMHSGFLGIRNELPMNLKQQTSFPEVKDSTQRQIHRVNEICTSCLDEFGRPWLMGEDFSIVDVMYIPVVTRFKTYSVDTTEQGRSYMQSTLERASVKQWIEDAKAESAELPFIDQRLAVEKTPLTPG